MKKLAILICIVLIFSSCTLFLRKTHITWPDKIEYMEAICDLDMSWRDLRYSGSMSIKMKYPDRLHIEVYGPFGETVVLLMKDRDEFLFTSGNEKINDERKFEERFGIKLNEFIDDIAMRNYLKNSHEGVYSRRENYVVIYELGEDKDRICWKGKDGSICVRFIEAAFDEEGKVGKSSNGEV